MCRNILFAGENLNPLASVPKISAKVLQELLIVFVVEVVVENKQPKAKATESDSSCLIRWEKYNVNSVDGVQYFLDVNKVEFKTETTLWQKNLKGPGLDFNFEHGLWFSCCVNMTMSNKKGWESNFAWLSELRYRRYNQAWIHCKHSKQRS